MPFRYGLQECHTQHCSQLPPRHPGGTVADHPALPLWLPKLVTGHVREPPPWSPHCCWKTVLARTPGWGGRTHSRAFIRVVRSSPSWRWERWCSFPSSVESSGCVCARGGGRSLQHLLVSLLLSFPCTSFSVANRDWEKRDLTPSRMSGSWLTSSSPMSQAESRGAFSWIYHKPKPREWLSPVEPK